MSTATATKTHHDETVGIASDSTAAKHKLYPEISDEQTADGAFRRQRNWFTARFGDGDGQYPVEPGRYLLLGSTSCGWNRRQQIILRLLGLDKVVPFTQLSSRDVNGWVISDENNAIELLGTDRLNEVYRRTDPSFTGRGTSPTVVDLKTGTVVTNNYHLLSLDWENAWKKYHKEGAPDLYPAELREEIDLLNQQILDDVNNGTYKVIFATNPEAARVAHQVFAARLADLNFRLASRRYLFGEQLTDSDVRLFVTLSSYERSYRPALARVLGEENVIHLQEYPHLWDYARDLFQQGFVDEREGYYLNLLPDADGNYIGHRGFAKGAELPAPEEALAQWQEPHGREALSGSPYYSGPGTGGSYELWSFSEK